MRILILGGNGMLGHKLAQKLSHGCEVYATVRREFDFRRELQDWFPCGVLSGVAVENPGTVEDAIRAVQPDAVVNCIAARREDCNKINGRFRQHLAVWCEQAGARLIHISSDGVFSGTRGPYTEDDPCDAEDAYGRTKALGEILRPNCLTLRTSIVGREIREPKTGIIEWLLSQYHGKLSAYRRAVFSGVTTCALSDIIRLLLTQHRELSGLFHVAGNPISKLSLLEAVRDRFALPIAIDPDDTVVYNRTLDGTALERCTGLRPPPWPDMIDELYTDSFCYRAHCYAQNC